MRTNFFRYTFFTAGIVLLLASCKVTQPYQSPDVQTDSLYRDVHTADT